MTAPTPTEPGGETASTTPATRNWLAPTSFLLSLGPLVAAVSLSHPSRGPADVVFVPLAALIFSHPLVALGIFVCAIGAIVTGGMALGRAKRYPPPDALKGLAITGLVLGILDIVLIAGGVCAIFSLLATA